MKKNILLFALVLMANPPGSFAQKNNLSALFYEVNGTRIFQVSGSNPQTEVEFYSEKGGGKLLQTATTDINGKAIFETDPGFRPAFVLNRALQADKTKKGNGFVHFIGPREFALQDISVSATGQVSCLASFSQVDGYELEVLRSNKDQEYTTVAVFNPVSTADYTYSYTDPGASESSAVRYKIRVRNTEKGIGYTTEPFSAARAAGLRVYPTLSSATINLELDKGTAQMQAYYITNSIGQVVQRAGLAQANQAAVNIENLAPGKYTVSTLTSNGKTLSAGFVKL